MRLGDIKTRRKRPITHQLMATVGGHWVYERQLGCWTCGDGKRYMLAFGGGYSSEDWEAYHYPREYFIYEPGKPTLSWHPSIF